MMDEHVARVLKLTDEVVKGYPGRLAGSESCQKAAERLGAELEAICDPGSVRLENFRCHPQAFIRHFPYQPWLFLAAWGFLLLDQPLGAVLATAAFFVLFLPQSLFYWHWFDHLFPAATGTNVVGTIEPRGQVWRQVILCGHHDAARTFRYLERSPRLYPLVNVLHFSVFVAGLALSILCLARGQTPGWVPVVMGVLALGVLPYFWFFGREVSPGAGDNLVASAMVIELGRLLRDIDGQGGLQHTRLVLLSTDAEEAGLCGSRAFARTHRDRLGQCPTSVICLDTFYRAEWLTVLCRDINQTVRLSRPLAQALQASAAGLGFPVKLAPIPFGAGATDAGSFARAGLETVCVIAAPIDIAHLPGGLPYHTTRDTVAAIEPRVVERTLAMVAEHLRRADATSARAGA